MPNDPTYSDDDPVNVGPNNSNNPVYPSVDQFHPRIPKAIRNAATMGKGLQDILLDHPRWTIKQAFDYLKFTMKLPGGSFYRKPRIVHPEFSSNNNNSNPRGGRRTRRGRNRRSKTQRR